MEWRRKWGVWDRKVIVWTQQIVNCHRMPKGFIPPHGGYADLVSYHKAEIVYDATVHFCDRFLHERDRTRDQMIQAARSGNRARSPARRS